MLGTADRQRMIVADSYGNASSIVYAGSGTMRCFLADADTPLRASLYRRIATAYKAKTDQTVVSTGPIPALLCPTAALCM